jgi:phosphonate transport system substrate-binding protein
VAFPSPAAFAASVLPQAEFRREGIQITPKYVSSHDSVYLAVAAGLYPAGGGVARTLNSLKPEVRADLRVLWSTRPYTPHAFASHPRVPEEAVARLGAAMAQMHTDPQGIAILGKLAMKGLRPASDLEWNDVRELNIDLLDELLEE